MDAPSSVVAPLYRHTFDADALAKLPPTFSDENKAAVYEHACPDRPQTAGAVIVTRWDCMPLQSQFDHDSSFETLPMTGVFRYAPSHPGTIDWHVNFAAADLFCAYSGRLLAQDELQVLEHPALGSVREAMLQFGASTVVTDHGGRPTPILVRGAERRCVVDTTANDVRPRGLYGNEFAYAEPEEILDAVERLDPPTLSNIVAIEAPSYGTGFYDAGEIRRVLTTAYTGFRAVVIESSSGDSAPDCVAIHTGFWGCGAYGGDRELMSAIQILAARLARVDRLVFFTFDEIGGRILDRGIRAASQAAAAGSVDDAIDWLADQQYEWGVSDGT